VLRAADLWNVSDDTGGLGYFRDSSRWRAPDNLFANPATLFKRAPLAVHRGERALAAEGGQLGGTTVIIQYVQTTRSIYYDVNHNYTPLMHTVGTGTALICRNGQVWHATWSRPRAAGGTTWMVNGAKFPLAAGQIWVLLVNRTTPATLK